MSRKGRVVTAAMLCMQNQSQIQNMRLKGGIAAVRAQNVQDVFGGGELAHRIVDEQAVAVVIVAVSLIAIDRQHREQRDQLKALPEHVGRGNIIRVFVIGIEGEHAAGQGVHHVAAGGLHDDVPHKAGGQGAVKGQKLAEGLKVFLVGQLAKEQQVGGALEAEVVLFGLAADELLHAVAPVVELALAGDALAVHGFAGDDFGNVGKAGEHALAV